MERLRVEANPDSGLRNIRWRPVGLIVLVVTMVVSWPSLAQKIHSFEPRLMDPYAIIYVNDGSCSAGKVLKVQDMPKVNRRKKSCVPLSDITGAPSAMPPK